VGVGRQERGGWWEGSTDGRAHDDSLFTAIKQNPAGEESGDRRALLCAPKGHNLHPRPVVVTGPFINFLLHNHSINIK
jgi:hypothetical protein